MALQKSAATLVAVKEETTFNTAVTFVDADVVPYTSATFTPTQESITRDQIDNVSLLPAPSLLGTSTSSGTLSMELAPNSAIDSFLADTILEVGIGAYDVAGATIGVASITDNTTASDGTAGLYYLSAGNSAQRSLSIKYVIGGAEANSVDIRGGVINSLKFNFPTQGIITVDADIGASTGFIPTTQTALTPIPASTDPFIAKNMTFEVDGTALCATDLEFTVSNEIADFKCVTTDGIGVKSLTKRTISGSFKVAFESVAQITAFNNATAVTLFASGTNTGGDKLAVYFPVVKRTSLDISDDGGIVVQTVQFEVAPSSTSSVLPFM